MSSRIGCVCDNGKARFSCVPGRTDHVRVREEGAVSLVLVSDTGAQETKLGKQ